MSIKKTINALLFGEGNHRRVYFQLVCANAVFVGNY